MFANRKLLFCSICAYFLLALYGSYFRYFHVIISPVITNILIFGLIVALLIILIYEPFQIKKDIDVYIILPQYILFTFLTRVIPTIRLTYQPLADPYYYFICTLNIIQNGTLEPVYSWWYSMVQQQLTWPDLHILGATLTLITNIQSVDLLRYILPLTGAFFFLGVFLLAKEVTDNSTIALLSGLFASTGDTVIFYQSEYHPQGLAIVYFVFLMALILRYFSTASLVDGLLVILYSIVFSYSHHFSSLFLGFFSVFIILIFEIFKIFFPCFLCNNNSQNLIKSFFLWILITVLMISNHLFNYPAFLELIKKKLDITEPIGQVITTSTTNLLVPLQKTILNSTKFVLFFLALFSIFYIFKSKDKKEFFCFIIWLGVVISGLIGTFIVFIPVDRIIGFYIPFAAIFASLTIFRIKEIWFVHWNPPFKTIIIIIISLIILIAGPLNSYPPGLIFQESPRDPYYWHSNDFSIFSTFGIPGHWINDNIPKRPSFSSYGDTFMIPFFYGQISLGNEVKDKFSLMPLKYFIINVNDIPNDNINYHNNDLNSNNLIYNTGLFHIGTTN